MGNKIPSNGSLGCTVRDKITRILWCYLGSIFCVYHYFGSALQSNLTLLVFVFNVFMFFSLVSGIKCFSHHSHVSAFIFSYILLFSPQCPKHYSRLPRNLFPKILLKVCCHLLEGREEWVGVGVVHGWILTPANHLLCMVLCFLCFNKAFIFVALPVITSFARQLQVSG